MTISLLIIALGTFFMVQWALLPLFRFQEARDRRAFEDIYGAFKMRRVKRTYEELRFRPSHELDRVEVESRFHDIGRRR